MAPDNAFPAAPERERDREPDCECGGERDRDLIRVHSAHDKLGIAAALRQAFAAAAADQSDHDFEKLLSELH